MSRIWEKKEDKYAKPLAKTHVTPIFLKGILGCWRELTLSCFK